MGTESRTTVTQQKGHLLKDGGNPTVVNESRLHPSWRQEPAPLSRELRFRNVCDEGMLEAVLGP